MDGCSHCQFCVPIDGTYTAWQAFTRFTEQLRWRHVSSIIKVETLIPHTTVSCLMLPLIGLQSFKTGVKFAPRHIHSSNTCSKFPPLNAILAQFRFWRQTLLWNPRNRSMWFPGQFQWARPTGTQLGNTLDEWIDNADLLKHDTVNWVSYPFCWLLDLFSPLVMARNSGMTSWAQNRMCQILDWIM